MKEENAHLSFTNKPSLDSHKDDNSNLLSDNSHYSLILDIEKDDIKDADIALSSLSSKKYEVFQEINTLMNSKNFSEIHTLMDISYSKEHSHIDHIDSRVSECKSDNSNKSIISHNSCEFDVIKTCYSAENSGNYNNLI